MKLPPPCVMCVTRCIASIGSDTGGSVRHPASFCGLVGVKPSYGMVPRHGLLSYASSLDCPGVIARSTLDAAVLLDAVAGSDARDPTAIQGNTPYSSTLGAAGGAGEGGFAVGSATSCLLGVHPHTAAGTGTGVDDKAGTVTASQLAMLYDTYSNTMPSLVGVNIGIPAEFSVEGLNADVLKAWDETIRMLIDAGATVRTVSLPSLKLALPCYYVLACAEASSNLSRYDGIRYGYRYEGGAAAESKEAQKYEQSDQSSEKFFDELRQTRGNGFGPEVIRRILTGTFVLSQSAYHDYFETAARCRQIIHEEINTCLSGSGPDSIHALLGPTTPVLPFALDAAPDPSHMLLNDLYTIQANLAGVPAVTVPVGTATVHSSNSNSNSNSSQNTNSGYKVPIGMQFIGRFREEGSLLRIARAVEMRSNFAAEIPEWLRSDPSTKVA
jgi:aspartyl-tRNA(Asn)/glutamyl-tRNA(Gln) amidotransferase subunit A